MCDSNLMDSKTKTFESLIESIEKNEEINLDTKDVLYKSLFENSNLSFFEKAYSLGKNFESFEDSKKISYINDLIYGLYKNLPYEQFNKTIGKLWLENSLGENLEKILDKDSIKTIENYQEHLEDIGYMDSSIHVNKEKNIISIKMENGCPYGTFCEKTNNEKCIRGRAFKDLLEISNSKNIYRPVLIKESTHDRECEIRLMSYEKVIDELIDEKEIKKQKHFL